MEAMMERTRQTIDNLREAMLTDYQRQVRKLQETREREYAEWLEAIKNMPPSRIFGDAGLREQDVRAAQMMAHHRRFRAKLRRCQAAALRRPKKPEPAEDSSGSLTQSKTPSFDEEDGAEGEEAEIDDDVCSMTFPPAHDSWAARLQMDKRQQLPPLLQNVRILAPIVGYTNTSHKAARKRARGRPFRRSAEKIGKEVSRLWPLDTHIAPGEPEACFDNATMQGLIDHVPLAAPEEQRRHGRVVADSREHQYISLSTKPSPVLCAACFAALLHELPNNDQPEDCGPTYEDVLEGSDLGEVGVPLLSEDVEASYFVRWETLDKQSGMYRLCGCSGTHEPQPLYRGLREHALKAAHRDERFFPIRAGQHGSRLWGLRVTVSIVHSLEVMNMPHDFELRRHGLLILFRDRWGKEWSSCLLPDVVQRLGNKDKALHVLIRKSGYQGKIHEDFYSRAWCCLCRLEASSCSMDYSDFVARAHLTVDDQMAGTSPLSATTMGTLRATNKANDDDYSDDSLGGDEGPETVED